MWRFIKQGKVAWIISYAIGISIFALWELIEVATHGELCVYEPNRFVLTTEIILTSIFLIFLSWQLIKFFRQKVKGGDVE